MPKRRNEQPRHRARRDHDLRRRPPARQGRAIILIVCEGEETEYRYFEAMRRRQSLLSVNIEVVRSGRQSDQLVQHAVDLRRRRAKEADALPYDEVWCVFDREAENEPDDFQASVNRADREGIRLAVSNPCFEYWYLLHYQATDRPFHNADEVCEALRSNNCLPGYRKNQDDMFEQLEDRLDEAMERAEHLYERHSERAQDRFPNPSTLVQRLVRRLTAT
jgi:hypothetical protein